jgi:hypothetical protein
MSFAALPSPMRMMAPLPNWRSICCNADAKACFLLSSMFLSDFVGIFASLAWRVTIARRLVHVCWRRIFVHAL